MEYVNLWPFSQGELSGRREEFIDRLFAGRFPRISGAPVGRGAVAATIATGGYPEVQGRWWVSLQQRGVARAPDRLRRMSDARYEYRYVFIGAPTVEKVNTELAKWANAGWFLLSTNEITTSRPTGLATAELGTAVTLFWQREVRSSESSSE